MTPVQPPPYLESITFVSWVAGFIAALVGVLAYGFADGWKISRRDGLRHGSVGAAIVVGAMLLFLASVVTGSSACLLSLIETGVRHCRQLNDMRGLDSTAAYWAFPIGSSILLLVLIVAILRGKSILTRERKDVSAGH